MNYFKLQWYNVNLVVACDKCGTKIPLQSVEGNPSCTNCGHIAKYSWGYVLKYCEVNDLKKGEPVNSTIIGEVQATVKSSKVPTIYCFSCNTAIAFVPNAPLVENCNQCSVALGIQTIKEMGDLVFYTQYKKNEPKAEGYIAVRCASCGAGIKTDPSSINYHCDACGVDNVLPMALRAKTVLNEVFLGVKHATFPPVLLDETTNPDHARKVLHQNKRGDFTNAQLEAALVRFSGNATIFSMIKDGYRLEIPSSVYETLWQKSNNLEICQSAGKALGKSEAEVTSRLQRIDPSYKVKQVQQGKKSGVHGSQIMVWVFAVLIGVMLIYIAYYKLFIGETK